MEISEIKELEGKRIKFCLENEGKYYKYEGKVSIEEVEKLSSDDEGIVKQTRRFMILSDCSINNVHTFDIQRFPPRKFKEIKNFKVVYNGR